jgi:hypothetical protein
MATPRKPRTRKSAHMPQIDLVPVEPTRRRASRIPPTYMMDARQPVQQTPGDADWVKARIVESTVEELSKVSLADAATIIRAAVQGQPIHIAPVARLAVLGLLNLGLVVYDHLAAPPHQPGPPEPR